MFINKRGSKALTVFSALLVLLLLAAVVPASANGIRKKVRVGYFDGGGFYEADKASGRMTGYAYDYQSAVAQYAGWDLEYVHKGWSPLLEMLIDGRIDVLADVSYTEARAEQMLFASQPMGSESYYLYRARRSKRVDPADLRTLDGCTVGVASGSVQIEMLESFLKRNNLHCSLVYWDNTEEWGRLQDENKIDAFVTIDSYVKEGYLPLAKIGESSYYFAVSKKRPDLLDDLNKGVSGLLAMNPYYNMELQKKYISGTVTKQSLNKQETEWLEDKGELKIGCLGNYEPYCGVDPKSGESRGLLSNLAVILEKQFGAKIKIVSFSDLNSMKAALRDDKLDAIFPIYGDLWTSSRGGYIQTREFASDRIVAVYKDRYAKITSADEIAIAGDSAIEEPYVEAAYPSSKRKKYATIEDALDAVDDGKADVLIGTNNVMLRFLNGSPRYSELRTASLNDTVSYCFAVNRGDTVLLSILDKARSYLTDAEIAEIVMNNAAVEQNYSFSDFLRQHTLPIMLCFSCIAGVIILLLLCLLFKTRESRARLQKANDEVRSACEKANRANSAKTEFLSRISHDIRTPLNGIIGMAYITEKLALPSEARENLKKINISSKFLLSLINDVLDMSKAESGRLKLNPEPYYYSDFSGYIDAVVRPLCDDKDIALTFEAPVKSGVVPKLDVLRVNQIYFNLLSNAVKFTRPGGSIRVTQRERITPENRLNVSVVIADNGIGMSEEFQQVLFEPFTQENRDDISNTRGSGLGLAIVRKIIDAMGGSISVTSRVGEGTSFSFTFDCDYVEDHDPDKAKNASVSAADLALLREKHVLLCEDHPLNREIAETLLAEKGVSVDAAENGAEGVKKFAGSALNYYAAVLMDIRMPVMNGYEAAAAIRALSRADANTTPIIAMTADAFADDIKKCLEVGMNAHIAKPVDPQTLYETLSRLLKEAHQA